MKHYFGKQLFSKVTRAQVTAMALGATLISIAALSQPVWAQATKAATPPAAAAASSSFTSTKVGFVNTQRILRDSEPAIAILKKIDDEFMKRNDELQKNINDLRNKVQKFEKDAPVMAESERSRNQRELGNLDIEVQRKQRELQEDYNRRRNEEFGMIVEKANAAIKRIAEQENFDIIIQDAITVSPRVDITDQVIQSLAKK
jgi:outer membrane protein